jgi:tetratricopeptide (TPR) repeat protein
MRLSAQLLFIVLLTQAVAAQEAVQSDVPAEAAAQFAAAETYKDQNEFEQSQQVYSWLRTNYPNSFTIAYNYGRLLAQMKEYQKSAEILAAVLKAGEDPGQVPDPSIYNTIGFVHIMLGDFEQAIECFNKAAAPKIYERLSATTKMKLHNNTGLAMMLADRYEESLQEFAQAKELGSRKAAENIEKVKSLIETQEKQNPDIPGIFAVVIHSTRDKERLDAKTDDLTKKIQSALSKEKQQDLDEPVVYLAKNGMYFITLASNSSYAKAQELLTDVRKVVNDAFVSSTTNWEPYQIAGELLPPLQEAAVPGKDGK